MPAGSFRPDAQPGELDRATAGAEPSLSLRRIDRARRSLEDVKVTQQRIHDQEYGWRGVTEAEIGLNRLQEFTRGEILSRCQ